MNQWAVSSVLSASFRERGWAQWNTHDALASGGTPRSYRCTFFIGQVRERPQQKGANRPSGFRSALTLEEGGETQAQKGVESGTAFSWENRSSWAQPAHCQATQRVFQMPDLNNLLVFKPNTTWTPCCQLSASRSGPLSAEVVKLRPTGHV